MYGAQELLDDNPDLKVGLELEATLVDDHDVLANCFFSNAGHYDATRRRATSPKQGSA